MNKTNPFFDMDVKKVMGDFKIPGFDLESLMAAQRRNIEALTQANQLALEGMQAISQRQAEILRQTMEETMQSFQSVMQSASPEERMGKQTELLKVAFERATANMRELAEMVSKSNAEACSVMNKRVAESLDEIKGLLAKTQRR
jgi:phasin family protein